MKRYRFKIGYINGIVCIVLFIAVTTFGRNGDTRRPVRFLYTRSGQEVRVQLVTLFGTINIRSRHILSKMLGPKGTTRTMLLHSRLLLMLQKVAEQYPGKTIVITSGFRIGKTDYDEPHKLGRAVDFRVEGVKTEIVYEFIKTLRRCGTGFYPKANFVHLDIREEAVTWIDHFHQNQDCSLMERASQESGSETGQELEFLSVWNNEKATLVLVTESGHINNRSRQIVSQLAASKVNAARVSLLHPRLILLLQKIANEFPGHRFKLFSGYRSAKNGFHSYHNYGRALDFSLEGVDNKRLYDFARTFKKCGVGYYPNSVFIHLDVRDKSATWVDYSGIGEPAQYGKQK